MNKYRPHILVLPEDDANRQLANGFLLDPLRNERAIQVLPNAGGWQNVLADFTGNHLDAMRSNLNRHMVLLIDFDKDDDRWVKVKAIIPSDLNDRVFVLGVWSEPENLRRQLQRSFEQIGESLANDCRDGSSTTWKHELLQHNRGELSRMTSILRPILFP